MNQYCRYCCFSCITDCEDIFWCSEHMKTYPASKAKRINKCKDFQFNSYDLFGMDESGNFREYKPRDKYNKTKIDDGFVEMEQIQFGW